MPEPCAADVAAAFLDPLRATLAEGMRKVEHCAAQLTEEQIWWRPRPEMNSIANLLSHLAGNVGQWLVAGVGGGKDTRNRPAEFADRSCRPKDELLSLVRGAVAHADSVLARLTSEDLLAPRRIQGFDERVASALVATVAHFRGHVQEIIHMTREQLGNEYRFDFVPAGPEQESAAGRPA